MNRAIICLAFILSASAATAQSCPEFFRFVDFGLLGRDGAIHRGGPIFRAEGFTGQRLLVKGRSECLEVQDISKDGHGNPIPVVKHITYDPAKTGIDLVELGISAVNDTGSVAEIRASEHRENLKRPDARITRGENYLCASHEEHGSLSCQVVSPYKGTATLVIYCDTVKCTMPVLAINQQLMARATWTGKALYLKDQAAAGSEITEKATRIFDFLQPLSSGL